MLGRLNLQTGSLYSFIILTNLNHFLPPRQVRLKILPPRQVKDILRNYPQIPFLLLSFIYEESFNI